MRQCLQHLIHRLRIRPLRELHQRGMIWYPASTYPQRRKYGTQLSERDVQMLSYYQPSYLQMDIIQSITEFRGIPRNTQSLQDRGRGLNNGGQSILSGGYPPTAHANPILGRPFFLTEQPSGSEMNSGRLIFVHGFTKAY